MSPAIVSVLTSRTLWLAVLTAGLPPVLRALGVAPEVLTDELLGILATVGALIAAARLTTTAPVHRRGRRRGTDPAPEAPSLVFPPEPRP